MSAFLQFVFYLSVSAIYVFGIITDNRLFYGGKYTKAGFPFDNSFGGRAKFLTYINMSFQLLYFTLGFFIAFGDLVCGSLFRCKDKCATNEACGTKSKLKTLHNLLYRSIVFPIGIYVSIIFWTLYLIDRKLVFPHILDSIMPVWLNHILHTLPIVSLLVENTLTRHVYGSFAKSAFVTGLFISSYISWTLFIASKSGRWVYPVLQQLTPVYRALFIAAQVVIAWICYKIGESYNSLLWGAPAKSSLDKDKKTS